LLTSSDGTLADLENNFAGLTSEQATATTEVSNAEAARVLSKSYKEEAE
jgi:hypothetical protein